MKKIGLFFTFLLVTTSAFADPCTNPNVNNCAVAGGGACTYRYSAWAHSPPISLSTLPRNINLQNDLPGSCGPNANLILTGFDQMTGTQLTTPVPVIFSLGSTGSTSIAYDPTLTDRATDLANNPASVTSNTSATVIYSNDFFPLNGLNQRIMTDTTSVSVVYRRWYEAAPPNCLFGGVAYTPLSVLKTYTTPNPVPPVSCASVEVTSVCDTVLLGTWQSPAPAGSTTCNNGCSLDGINVADGQSAAFYQDSYPAGICVSLSRNCSGGTTLANGSFDGNASYNKASCHPGCMDPTGSWMTSGSSRTFYLASSGATCDSEIRNCNEGLLSGSYTFPSCTVAVPPPPPLPPASPCTIGGGSFNAPSSWAYFLWNSSSTGSSISSVHNSSGTPFYGTGSENAPSCAAPAMSQVIASGSSTTISSGATNWSGSMVVSCNNGSATVTSASCASSASTSGTWTYDRFVGFWWDELGGDQWTGPYRQNPGICNSGLDATATAMYTCSGACSPTGSTEIRTVGATCSFEFPNLIRSAFAAVYSCKCQ